VVLADYPLESKPAPGWHFRCEGQSVGQYVVEGRDPNGRIVSHHGFDLDALLARCIAAQGPSTVKSPTDVLAHRLTAGHAARIMTAAAFSRPHPAFSDADERRILHRTP
jgi:hypothetical protein